MPPCWYPLIWTRVSVPTSFLAETFILPAPCIWTAFFHPRSYNFTIQTVYRLAKFRRIFRKGEEEKKKVISDSKVRRCSKMGIRNKLEATRNGFYPRDRWRQPRRASRWKMDASGKPGDRWLEKSHGFPEVRPRFKGQRGDRKWGGGRGRRPPISLLN